MFDTVGALLIGVGPVGSYFVLEKIQVGTSSEMVSV